MAWIEGVDLRRGEPILVPFAAVSADYTRPPTCSVAGLCMTTGGLGAGNDRAEAMLQGLTELVERDAVTLWRPVARSAPADGGRPRDHRDHAGRGSARAR